MRSRNPRFAVALVLLMALMLQLMPTTAFAASFELSSSGTIKRFQTLYMDKIYAIDNVRKTHISSDTYRRVSVAVGYYVDSISLEDSTHLIVKFNSTARKLTTDDLYITDKSGSTMYIKSVENIDGSTVRVGLYNSLIKGDYTLHHVSLSTKFSFDGTAPAPTAAPTAEPTVEPTAAPTAAPTAVPTSVPTEAPTAAPTAQPTEMPAVTPHASALMFSSSSIEVKTRDSEAVRLFAADQLGNTFDLSHTPLKLTITNMQSGKVTELAETQTYLEGGVLISMYRFGGKPRVMVLAQDGAAPGTWRIKASVAQDDSLRYAVYGYSDTLMVTVIENPEPIVWPVVSSTPGITETIPPTISETPSPTPANTETEQPTDPPTTGAPTEIVPEHKCGVSCPAGCNCEKLVDDKCTCIVCEKEGCINNPSFNCDCPYNCPEACTCDHFSEGCYCDACKENSCPGYGLNRPSID